jgi:hypothetical protein
MSQAHDSSTPAAQAKPISESAPSISASVAKITAKSASRQAHAPGRRPHKEQQHRPVRRPRSAKAAALSPEARRLAEEQERRCIEEFLNAGKLTRCEARWAVGAIPLTMFGTEA